MTSIEHVCQRRADHALPGWAGSGMARSKRREIRRMQLGSVRRCSLMSVQSHIYDVVSSAASKRAGRQIEVTKERRHDVPFG